MADDNFMHTAELMKAALPYVDVQNKTTVEFIYKFLDLMGSYQNLAQPKSIAACGFEKQKMNFEGILTGIRPLLNDRERTLIDRILNIFNIKRMIENYSKMMSAMKDMPGFEGFPFGAAQAGSSTGNSPGGPAGMDFSSLFNMMSGQNFSNMFGQNSTPTPEKTSDSNAENPFEKYWNDINHTKVDSNDSNATPATEANTHSEHSSNSNTEENPHSESDANSKAAENTKSESSYQAMINTLKSMIPEDKRDTYENLSMLFKDSSYDDNSKTEHSRE